MDLAREVACFYGIPAGPVAPKTGIGPIAGGIWKASMTESIMAREIQEIPEVVRRQVHQGFDAYRAIGEALRKRDPAVVVTSARGSSDHATLYLKYLVETRLGIPVASIGPSVASIYGTRLRLEKAALVAVSQSGASEDLLALLEASRNGGALTTALVNAENSPAASAAEMAASLLAGQELAVAASKSYIASLVAIAAIIATWTKDHGLSAALIDLPDALSAALGCDWSAAEEGLWKAKSAYCLSRGPALCLAYEAALKLKETCGLHAEGFSATEVLHGPVVLAEPGFSALLFVSSDAARQGILDTAKKISETGSQTWLVDSVMQGRNVLKNISAPHPALTPICQAISFYVFVERLSRLLGRDPDWPPHLRKVTRTL